MKNVLTKRRIFCGAVILAVIIVPFLYSYFYLGAFWDPYSKLEKLPVAVVNNDKGAEVNGSDRNLGQEMCDRLKDDGSLKFIFTDEATAKAGTEGKDYYATITIPENFSENIASASSENKKTATITYSPNEKRNFLASQILSRAVLQIEEETRSNIDKEIVKELADNVKGVPDKLTELQDGLGKLEDGSSKLLDGTGTLLDGTGKLFDGTKTLTSGTNKLLDGSSKLATGTGTLLDGTNKLANGTGTLVAGADKLASGTKTFYGKFNEYQAGVSTVAAGSQKLADGSVALQTGIGQLKAGTDQLINKTSSISMLSTGAQMLAEGTKTFDTGLTQYTTGVNSLISNVTNTATFLSQYAKANPSIMKDPTFAAFMAKLADPTTAQSIQTLQAAGTKLQTASTQLVQGSAQLSTGAQNLPALNTALKTLSAGVTQVSQGSTSLAQGADTLNNGVSTLNKATGQLYTAAGSIADGAAALSSGAKDLNNGAANLKKGAKDLNNGANNLKDGIKTLDGGANDLKDGVSDLNNGAKDLNSGASKLNDGIATAKSGVDTSIKDANDQVNNLNGLAEFASAPVSIEQQNVTTIPNYGTAFAPYFMSLSLWVGALILFVGIYLDTEGRFKVLSRESEHVVVRSFSYMLISFVQAIALALIVKNGLGLKVDNIPLYYLSICLVSMVFTSMIQFFIVHLKSAGKLISIVMLILQLTSCGGTFPMELVPKMFNVLYPYMPMTYSVALFKQAITQTDGKAVAYNVGILLTILVVFMVATVALSAAKYKKSAKSEVHMPVQLD
jgi:YhgE/Pip N-terminal domain/YhgE/Pip C-terminal domain